MFVPVAILSGVVYAGDVGVFGTLTVLVIGTIAGYWFQGMVVEAARDILDGRRDHTVGSLVRSVTAVVGPLIVAGILAGLAVGVGLLLLIVPGLFLLTIWSVLAPVIVIERKDALRAFGRSSQLVKGHGWQVFTVILILFVVQFVITAVMQALAESIADSVVGYSVGDLILRLLVAPLSALAAAVLYFELTALHGEPATTRAARRAAAPPVPPPPAAPTTGTEDPGPARPADSIEPRMQRQIDEAASGGFGQESRRDSPPDLVLPFDALFARGADALGVERRLDRLRASPTRRASRTGSPASPRRGTAAPTRASLRCETPERTRASERAPRRRRAAAPRSGATRTARPTVRADPAPDPPRRLP